MSPKKKTIEPPRLVEEYYRTLGLQDEKVFSNIEMGIGLYRGKRGGRSRSADTASDFTRSLGIFTTSYVRMVQDILRASDGSLDSKKRFFIDFGAVDLRLVSNPKLVDELANETIAGYEDERYEMYYLHDWLEKVARGAISSSSEKAQVKSKTTQKEREDRLKEKGKKIEAEIEKYCKEERDTYSEAKGVFRLFSPDGDQNEKVKILKKIKEKTGRLLRIVNELNVRYAELDSIERKSGIEKKKGDNLASLRQDRKYTRMREEFEFLINVIRSCAVRGGLLKSTPALVDKWVAMDDRLSTNTKKRLAEGLGKFEKIDHAIFHDKKGNRKPPKILILPGVGTGMSWSDRIMFSLFPPSSSRSEIAIARTLAGFRWYNATSSFNWKHLSGVGSAYQLVYPDKTFNSLQKSFEDDYVNWVTKESRGYQVLTSEVRRLFWKMIPFDVDLKRKLSKRATVYTKLYSEEIARQ